MAPRQRALTEPNLARALQLLPDEFGNYLNSVTHDTAVPTVLRAGDQINIVPGEAEAWVDGRFLPGQTAEGFLDEIRQVVGPGCEIEPIEVTRAVHGNSDSLLYQSITSSIHRYDAGATVLPSMMSGSSDARHLARLGTRCVGFAPLRVPANFPAGRLIHGNDERIPVDGYLWGTQVLLDTVLDFCTA